MNDKLAKAFLPTLLSFGPIFIVIGLQGETAHYGGSGKWVFWFTHLFALIGAVMLSIGLTTMYVKQNRLDDRLRATEKY